MTQNLRYSPFGLQGFATEAVAHCRRMQLRLFDPIRARHYDEGMQRAHVLAEQRKHPRAHLNLPARLRWQGPLGMRLEITETIDVAREGVLLHRDQDSLAPMSRVWIAFPFDPDAVPASQPETPARVVRVEREPGGGFRVGLQLQIPARSSRTAAERERRGSARVAFSLPIFVRPAGTPWPEESMTRDFSRCGVRFETAHVYAEGDAILAKIPWGEWAEAGEIPGRVVRVEACDSTSGEAAGAHGTASEIFSCVAVEWTKNQRGLMAAARIRKI